MNIHHTIIISSVLLIFQTSYSAVVQAGEHILIPKVGIVDRSDNTNLRANNDNFELEDDLVISPGFTYLYRLDNGFAFGAETFSYKNDIVTRANNDGDVTTSHLYAVVEKMFNIDGDIKPYVGVGLGFVSMKFNGHINGDVDDDNFDFASGLSYELLAGTEFKITDRFGVTVEYKYFDYDINDDIGNKDFNVESDGSALFVGFAIHI